MPKRRTNTNPAKITETPAPQAETILRAEVVNQDKHICEHCQNWRRKDRLSGAWRGWCFKNTSVIMPAFDFTCKEWKAKNG